MVWEFVSSSPLLAHSRVAIFDGSVSDVVAVGVKQRLFF